MSDPAVEIEGLCFSLGGKPILRDISCRVERGEYWSVVGPNGAGKSSLLKRIMRIFRGGEGRIRIHGRPLERYSQRELAARVSYVPQAGGRQPFPFTVHEFVLMGRYPHLSPFSSVSRRDEEAAREIMATTGVEEFTDRPLHTLSGGERQKVYIAAALAQGGDILLLDEPTSFLDYKHQAEVVELLRRLNRESGATVIAVTHDINSAVLSSHRILALKKGQVVFTGTPAEILNPETLGGIYDAQFEFLSHPGTNATFVAPQGILP